MTVPIARMIRKPKVTVSALAIVAVLGLLIGWYVRRSAQIRWAHETAIPEIARLADKGEDDAAFTLAKKVDAVVPATPCCRNCGLRCHWRFPCTRIRRAQMYT